MKIEYKFHKHNNGLSSTYTVYDGFSASASINDPSEMLSNIFNWRIEDAQSWSEIIEDIETVMSTKIEENIYSCDGTLYRGKYNIEQSNAPDSYCLRVCYSTNNDISHVEIYTYRDRTLIEISKPFVSVQIPTDQILPLLKEWRNFLLSNDELIEEELDMEIVNMST